VTVTRHSMTLTQLSRWYPGLDNSGNRDRRTGRNRNRTAASLNQSCIMAT